MGRKTMAEANYINFYFRSGDEEDLYNRMQKAIFDLFQAGKGSKKFIILRALEHELPRLEGLTDKQKDQLRREFMEWRANGKEAE